MKGPPHDEIILLIIKNQGKKFLQTLISGAISPITTSMLYTLITFLPCYKYLDCHLLYSINSSQCPTLKVSTATCAAALGLPNLNYVLRLNKLRKVSTVRV